MEKAASYSALSDSIDLVLRGEYRRILIADAGYWNTARSSSSSAKSVC